jgi:putative FmdB family regulatory protein
MPRGAHLERGWTRRYIPAFALISFRTMPTYEFKCPDGHEFDKFFRKISDAVAELPCPVCGKPATRQVSGGAGLLFKGSGFYITDYGKDGKKNAAGAKGSGEGAGKSSSEGAAESGAPAKSESKGESKSEKTPPPAKSKDSSAE